LSTEFNNETCASEPSHDETTDTAPAGPAPPDGDGDCHPYFNRLPPGDYPALIDSYRRLTSQRGFMLEVSFRITEGPHAGRVLANQRFFAQELDARRAKFVRSLLVALGASPWDGSSQAAEAAINRAISASHRVRLAVDWEGYDESRAPADPSDWQARDKATIRGARKFTNQKADGSVYALGLDGGEVRPTAVVVKVSAVSEELATAAAERATEALEDPGPSKGRFRILSETELLSKPDATWLIRGVLLEGTVAAIVGKSGTGKTFLAADIAVHLAYEPTWEGHAVVSSGHVLYVTAEGGAGNAKKRLTAVLQAHGHAPRNRIHTLPEPVNLLDKKSVDALLADIRALPIPEGERVALIVFDTLARCFVGGDEQSARDMGQFVDALGRATRELGSPVTVLVIHHVGKDGSRGSRGSSALPAALDTEIEVKRDGKTMTVSCTKQKDDEPFKRMQFRLKQVRVGEDAEGHVLTSCILERAVATEGEASAEGTPSLKQPQRSERLLLPALKALASFGSTGAKIARWHKDAEALHRMSVGTLNRKASAWSEQGYIGQPRGAGTEYVVTEKGRALLGDANEASS